MENTTNYAIINQVNPQVTWLKLEDNTGGTQKWQITELNQ